MTNLATNLATNFEKANRSSKCKPSAHPCDSFDKTFTDVPGKLKPTKYSCIPVLHGFIKKTRSERASESKDNVQLTRQSSELTRRTRMVFDKSKGSTFSNPPDANELKRSKNTRKSPSNTKVFSDVLKVKASDPLSCQENCSTVELLAQKKSSSFSNKDEQKFLSKDALSESATRVISSSLFTDKGKLEEDMIMNLYETLKSMRPNLIEKREGNPLEKNTKKLRKFELEKESKELNPQELYENVIRDICEVWTCTSSLFNDVRDHTIKYVEERSCEVGRKQLALEADMVQLAVDFAVSYSKGKTDTLVNGIGKNSKQIKWQNDELEDFMNVKIFSSLYNEDDLNAMAQTIKNFSVSVHKAEDFE